MSKVKAEPQSSSSSSSSSDAINSSISYAQQQEHKLIEFLQSSITTDGDADAVSDNDIRSHFGDAIYTQYLPSIINSLLAANRISLLQDKEQGVIYYKLKNEETVSKFKDILPGSEHMHVYECCQRAGNHGIWSRDIKLQTNIPQHTLTKILKDLEKKNILKKIQTVQSKSKKVYMLYELEPAKEVTGGPWYTDNNFDTDFIDTICKFIENTLSKTDSATVSDLHKKTCSILKDVELSISEIEDVVKILVYDGKIEEVPLTDGSTVKRYAFNRSKPFENAFNQVPCGVCPVIADCCDDGIISPTNCVYMTEWIKNSLAW